MENDTRELLEKLAGGEISVDDALLKLKLKPFEDIGYAKVDTHRSVRQGVAEVIYGAGKTTEQITGIAKKMLENGQKTILITRLSKESAEEIQKELPLDYKSDVHIGIIGEKAKASGIGKIVVTTLIKNLEDSVEDGYCFQLEATPTNSNRDFYIKCGMKYKPSNQDGTYLWIRK